MIMIKMKKKMKRVTMKKVMMIVNRFIKKYNEEQLKKELDYGFCK